MNNIKSLFQPSNQGKFSKQQLLMLIGLAALAAFLISVAPIVNLLNYPFRLFFTIIHELGHGLAAILTGGDFQNFSISPNGSGVAYSAGGWRFIIIPAGYLSVAVFAAILIAVGRSHRWSRVALGLVGGLMIILSLCFGRPADISISALVGSVLTVVTGVLFGALLLWLALKSSAAAVIFSLYFIAIKAGFTAFSDIVGLIGLSTSSGPVPQTDALSMAELTRIPAVIWAIVWVVMALVVIGGAIWVTWFARD